VKLLPRSLFGRLVLLFAGALTLALAVALALNLHERHHLLSEASFDRIADHVATTVRLVDRLEPHDRRTVMRLLSRRHHRVSLVRSPPPATAPPRFDGFARALRAALGPAYPVRFLAQPPGGRRVHALAVRLHDGDWVEFTDRGPPARHHWPTRLLVQIALLLGVAILVSLYAVSRVTRPLALFADAARALGRDIRRPALAETGPAEVRRAAKAFNLMQRRLVGFLDSRIRMLTAVSHDLKTPVTRLRLRAELLDDETLRKQLNADLDEMDAMLAGALAYLRGEGSGEQVQPVDVNALAESIATDARDLGQDVLCTAAATAPYPARPQALRRCLDNLVQNALRYGGGAEITVEEGPGTLVIRVSDRGPGLPESELERAFEPFYRVEGSRNRETGGTGLGLAIARDVAEAHGGTLVLANRPGGGLVATVTLPRVAT